MKLKSLMLLTACGVVAAPAAAPPAAPVAVREAVVPPQAARPAARKIAIVIISDFIESTPSGAIVTNRTSGT